MGKNIAVIMAAGKGKRMKLDINKQFIMLKGKPVLYYTLEAFNSCPEIDGIIIVAAKDEIKRCQEEVVTKYHFNKVISIVPGGAERHNSVFNGLQEIERKHLDCNIVIIHDGARPFVEHELIKDGIRYADIYGAAACGVTPKDTIKSKKSDNFSAGTLDRDKLFCVQTPQSFKFNLIYNCHKRIYEIKDKVTDDTMVTEWFGNNVYLYEGSYDNIKITTTCDIAIGQYILSK